MTGEPPSPDEVLHAADPEALLPGEDPELTYLQDAVHWVRVYGELLELKLALLDRADQVLESVSDDAMREADIDDRLLRAEAARYTARQQYWKQRVTELAASSSQGASEGAAGGSHG